MLIRLDEKMDMILDRLKKGDDCMKEHDSRISKLENFSYTLLGIGAGISMLISTAGYWILNHLRFGGS